jgi:hypothetical protein
MDKFGLQLPKIGTFEKATLFYKWPKAHLN